MSTEDQARALMMRHHHWIKNRQQAMLGRAAAEFNLSVDDEYWTHTQGKPEPSFRASYDRSNAGLS